MTQSGTALGQETREQQEKVSTTIPRALHAQVVELERTTGHRRATVLRAALKVGIPIIQKEEEARGEGDRRKRTKRVARRNR